MTEDPMDVLRTGRCECGTADCAAIVEISWEEQDEVDHADTNQPHARRVRRFALAERSSEF